ncbi:MAG: NAD(P)(+) transhydrogenase (Re/Si-specific) subunit beta [Chitinophagaceae bacterium]|nr:NAD(P)(+) transhydrogenase (Re/Si-specific) subunit beta [Chitinophagaceae bacterium]MBP9102909.1 NAD(P)(+) transhydrogenase (Re/Si-specific) subunit beta [Chitinophagaceae bacterium]
MGVSILAIIYIIAAVTFIMGLKMMSNPASARKGNMIAGVGMVAAILGTIFLYRNPDGGLLQNHIWIFAAIAVGTIIGVMAAKKVKMTAMPEMVSLFNGLGGASATLISVIEFNHLADQGFPVEASSAGTMAIIFAGVILGNITFSGSIVAWGKLSGKFKDFAFKGQHIINLLLLGASIALAVFITSDLQSDTTTMLFYVVFMLSLVYGIFFVLPIGGADMPVVISLLNSLSGLSAACSGFLYDNKVVFTGGILVGAAGTILTVLMCKAMNRSLVNVLIGSFGGGGKSAAADGEQGQYKEISLNDAAVVMSYANKVLIVPGYGLAVAQAQHTCHELEKLLEVKGVQVKYAIHPVAGRMPGHMNVLLAEADVSYDKLLEMEEANDEFPTTDVVLILGANDVVNPAAKTDPGSPIYGMPILDVELAKNVIVNKRSMKPGYAGIENGLFYRPKTSMLFGDAKKVLQDLCGEIKSL